MTIINVFRHIVRHSKVCVCIVHDSLIALAHEVADPAKGDDGEDTSFGLRAHLLAVHKLPVCQHLQSQSCSHQSKVSQISHFSQVRKHVSAFLQNNITHVERLANPWQKAGAEQKKGTSAKRGYRRSALEA
jgi:hypothetical protein